MNPNRANADKLRTFFRRCSKFTITLTCILFVTGCVSGQPTREVVGLTLSVSGDLSQVTVIAENVSLYQILETLETRHQVEVRPSGVPDELITIRLENVSLNTAIKRLLPEGARFVIRTNDRELNFIVPPSTDKLGEPEGRDRLLPTKDKTIPLAKDQRVVIKTDPQKWQPPARREGRGLKLPSKQLLKVDYGRGKKAEKDDSVSEWSLRLHFVMNNQREIRLSHIAVVDGEVVENNILMGPYLFVVRGDREQIVHFGSFADPLEMHSYLKDGSHDSRLANEGTFGIWLSHAVASEDRIANISITFFDAREAVIPDTLDEKALRSALESAKYLGQVNGGDIRTLMLEARNQ